MIVLAHSSRPIVAETLFTGAEQKHGDTVLGEVDKSSFNFFARLRGPQWTNALKILRSTLEGVVRSFKEQGMISSCTILGLVGIKVKFQVSSTFLFQLI